MNIERDGATIQIDGETHVFATAEAAEKRARFMAEALTWIGTPFVDLADIKGRAGGVDCAMLMVRASVDTGLLPAFDPRPYPPRWHLHRDEERFVNFLEQRIGAREVPEARVGDILVYRIGRCFSHGAVVLSSKHLVHAWYSAGMCLMTTRSLPQLTTIDFRGQVLPRPVKAFDAWGG